MRILDIDLDFFLNDIKSWGDDYGERLDPEEYKSWKPEEVKEFLVNNCNIKAPINGCIIEHHHEAFYVLKKLIESNKLEIPFEIVHVDAHSDTGSGDCGYEYIMTELLDIDVKDRANSIKEIGCGNYLSFVMACRWTNKIIFIVHPKRDHKHSSDIMPYHLKNLDIDSNVFQLKKCNRSDLENGHPDHIKSIAEPEIPFELIKCEEYKEQNTFDFVILSKSPGYTTKTSDKLIPIIKKFMKNVENYSVKKRTKG